MVQVPQHQVPGVYHRRIGDIVVTALSDGYLDGTVDVLRNITRDEAHRMLTEAVPAGPRTSVNCYPIAPRGRLALVETGSGNYLQPTAGRCNPICAAGIDPAEIELVLLTHMHPDHSAGLTDPATGRACSRTPNSSCMKTTRAIGTMTRPWRRPANGRKNSISRPRASSSRRTVTGCALQQQQGGVSRGHRDAAERTHAGTFRLHDCVGQQLAADLGRYHPRAGDPGAATRVTIEFDTDPPPRRPPGGARSTWLQAIGC